MRLLGYETADETVKLSLPLSAVLAEGRHRDTAVKLTSNVRGAIASMAMVARMVDKIGYLRCRKDTAA